jgi:S1-C subfamily serine protease
MEDVEPGQNVVLDLRRDGKPVKVTVAARPMDPVFFAGPMGAGGFGSMQALPAMPPMHGMGMPHGHRWLLEGWSDAELVKITPGLGRYFGADKGVLVARAPSDATLGLQDGDVIVAIGGREPQSGPHAMRILRSYQPGESVEIRVLRDRKAQTLKATVPEAASKQEPHMRIAPPRPLAEPPSAT